MAIKVGDVFYKVNKRHTGIPRKKDCIFVDGRHWYAYEKPIYEFSVSTVTVIGVLEKHLSGEWKSDSSYDLITEICVKEKSISEEKIYVVDEDYILKNNAMFINIDDAMNNAEELRKEVEELDH